jgi:hypothetical protein
VDRPPFAGISGQATRRGQLAASIVIDEEVEFGHALGHAHETETLIAQGRPGGDAGKSIGGHRALDPLGKAELAGGRSEEADSSFAERAERALRFVEVGLGVARKECAMDGDRSLVETDRRNHGRQKASATLRAKRRLGMKAEGRRCGEDAAALKICLCRTGTQWLCVAPDPQRCRRGFARYGRLGTVDSRRT